MTLAENATAQIFHPRFLEMLNGTAVLRFSLWQMVAAWWRLGQHGSTPHSQRCLRKGSEDAGIPPCQIIFRDTHFLKGDSPLSMRILSMHTSISILEFWITFIFWDDSSSGILMVFQWYPWYPHFPSRLVEPKSQQDVWEHEGSQTRVWENRTLPTDQTQAGPLTRHFVTVRSVRSV